MKDKGFTLVELIATITILTIVILIATPIVLSTIDNAKRDSAIDSMYLYVRAVEMSVNADPKMAGLLGGTYMTKDADLYTGTTLVLEVETKGIKPEDNGKVIMVDGDVLEANLILGGYKVIYKNKKATISVTG